jgi:hypothetical protein
MNQFGHGMDHSRMKVIDAFDCAVRMDVPAAKRDYARQ